MTTETLPGSPLAGAPAAAEAVEALIGIGAVAYGHLVEPWRRALLEEAKGRPFRRARPVVGSGERVVRQDMEVCADIAADGVIARFRAVMARALADAFVPWAPFPRPLVLDSMMLQRYADGALGITAHRDSARYINLVVVCSLSGEARFVVSADRAGRAPHPFVADAGSVILMRAPGFAGLEARPFHRVEAIRGRRLSLGLRQTRDGGGENRH